MTTHVKCKKHSAETIAWLEVSPQGVHATIRDREPVSKERPPDGKRNKPRIDKTPVNLEDDRAKRWAAGPEPYLETYCPRCNRPYNLGIAWMIAQAKSGIGTVPCPATVLS